MFYLNKFLDIMIQSNNKEFINKLKGKVILEINQDSKIQLLEKLVLQ